MCFVVTSQGKFAEAELLYERSQAILEKVLGPEHPQVAELFNNRAGVLAAMVSVELLVWLIFISLYISLQVKKPKIVPQVPTNAMAHQSTHIWCHGDLHCCWPRTCLDVGVISEGPPSARATSFDRDPGNSVPETKQLDILSEFRNDPWHTCAKFRGSTPKHDVSTRVNTATL